MSKEIPKSTKVVVIGGGVAGTSCAYHLAKFGWKDVVLLERDQLTSGTTWHAAGLVGQLGPSAAVTKIRKYSLELYKKLEKEIDFSSGLKLNGALSIATTKGRWQELKRQATTAQLYDVNVEVLNIDQIKKIYPIINEKDVLGGIFMPGDGQADPIGVTNLLAKAARKEGAKIFEKSPVEKIIKKNGRVAGVVVNGQTIECEYIVLATGMWSRQIGEDTGFSIPLYPAEHFYVVTEPLKEATSNLPVLRDTDGHVYIKEEAGKFLVGAFEPWGKAISIEKLPKNTPFIELPEDWDHFELPYTKAMELLEPLNNIGISKFFNGPESFTPDLLFALGEAPEMKNCFISAGYNSEGIEFAAGAGRALAEWIVEGSPTMDLSAVDIARFHPFQNKKGCPQRIGKAVDHARRSQTQIH